MEGIQAAARERIKTNIQEKQQPEKTILSRVSQTATKLKTRLMPQPVYEKYGDMWISLEPISRTIFHLRLHMMPPPSQWYYQVTIKTTGIRSKRALMSASLTSPTLSEMKAIKGFLVSLGYKSAFYQRLTEEGFRDVVIYG